MMYYPKTQHGRLFRVYMTVCAAENVVAVMRRKGFNGIAVDSDDEAKYWQKYIGPKKAVIEHWMLSHGGQVSLMHK